MTKYHLISFNLCPYVQRSVISLHEKDVDFELTYIDLLNKPEWFLEISPTGKVPLLKVTGDDGHTEVLFESAAICEYLDEVLPGPKMHPEDPVARAKHRAMIMASAPLGGAAWVMHARDSEEAVRKAVQTANKTLGMFEKSLGDGPYYGGDAFSMVDASLAPFLQRIAWSIKIEPSLAATFEGLPKVRAWVDALLERPSLKKSLLPNIDEIFVQYIKQPFGPDKPASWLSSRL